MDVDRAAEAAPTIFGSEMLVREIAERALPHWPRLEGARLTPVKVRENAVLQASLIEGARCALRIHRPGYHSDEALRSEHVWVAALRAAGVEAVAPIVARSGETLAHVAHGGVRFQVDLFPWVDATRPSVPLGGEGVATAEIVDQYQAIGATMARLHALSERWRPPGGFVRHALNGDGLVGEAPFWGAFWKLAELSVPQRALMVRLRDRLRVELAELGRSPDLFGMIHGDLMPDNVIFAEAGPCLIDFDDAGFGWYVFDIAVSLFSFSAREDFTAIRDAMIGSYRAHRDLADAALARLPMFVAARGAALLGWLHSRRQQEAARRAPWLIALACAAAEAWLDAGDAT